MAFEKMANLQNAFFVIEDSPSMISIIGKQAKKERKPSVIQMTIRQDFLVTPQTKWGRYIETCTQMII